MVMLAEALALDRSIDDFKIILVTDRVDLDEQIYKTFHHCGTQPVQAKTGKHLAQLLRDNKARIITTVIDKFELAVGKASVRITNMQTSSYLWTRATVVSSASCMPR